MSELVVAVYGTLRRGERNHQVLAGATFLGHATIRGTLHAIVRTSQRPYPYPALVEVPDGRVWVELYQLPDLATLARLDALERYDPDDVEGSEYLRLEVSVQGGPRDVTTAFAYAYRGPLDELGDVIGDGDWVQFAGNRPRMPGL